MIDSRTASQLLAVAAVLAACGGAKETTDTTPPAEPTPDTAA